MTDDIEEFAEELASTKTDTKMEWAAVASATPVPKEKYFDNVEPGDADARDRGLTITFETASGREINEWYKKPVEWDLLTSNLVLLLEFWGLDPGDVDRLNHDDVSFEVPLRFNQGRERWEPDWNEIERSVHTKRLEAQEDDDV